MNITDIPILELLPQRPPFVMVDKLVASDDTCTTSLFTVTADCIFVDDGHLIAEGMVENVAQTCAARMGYINYLDREHVKLGFIGAVRNMCFMRLPRVGEQLTTSVAVREQVFNMTLVEATVRVGDEVVATASMKIALSETDAQA
ncbi:MAG: pseudouridylate synthase [Bacteroidaceae bacterium]|nr:pseudouridylate synthase [Bacteroidaceae bacterium]